MTHRKNVVSRRLPAARGRVALGAAVAALTLSALLVPEPAVGQRPSTRAERTDWLETSRYEDVLGFIEAVEQLDGANVLHPTTFGYSFEGRPLPLVVVGRGLAAPSGAVVRTAGRTPVLVLANIHAGEVEGKEAAQMLLRRLVTGPHEMWLDSLIVLVAPIYNADGNERVSVLHRFRQNGPLAGVGQRPNAQGLDLNRDHMKLESPEARSLVALLDAYDPVLVIDLHTTDGTRHAYHLTYSPPLHPGTDPEIVGLLRHRLLPAATRELREEHGWHSWYYGNTPIREWGMTGERGWYTFDYRPRFNNNYLGLRNRFAVLSEAYSYASFEGRTLATLAFVEAILDFTARHGAEMRSIVEAADRAELRGRSIPLRAELERGEEVEILMGETEERLSPYSGRRYSVRLEVVRPERMPDYGSFAVTERERVPAAYYLPAELEAVADLLTFHGVSVRRLERPRRVRAERFRVDSMRTAEGVFQGHRERELFGAWSVAEVELPAGAVEVPMDQPLARLVFHLLEPRSPDGVANWNLIDEWLEAEPERYPILREPAPRSAGPGR